MNDACVNVIMNLCGWTQGILRSMKLFRAKRHSLTILDNVSGVIKPGRWLLFLLLLLWIVFPLMAFVIVIVTELSSTKKFLWFWWYKVVTIFVWLKSGMESEKTWCCLLSREKSLCRRFRSLNMCDFATATW